MLGERFSFLPPTGRSPATASIAAAAPHDSASSELDDECVHNRHSESFGTSSSSSSSSTNSSSSPSGTDAEQECPITHATPFRTIADRVYARAGSMGSAERIYAALESLPWHERAGRLVHFDIIHSEHRTKSRPLSGGITCYLVGMDVGAGFAVHRALKSTHAIGQAYREICVQQNWHNALITAHIVADGENALVAPLEAAAVAMGQSFEKLPPYSPNANFAGSNLTKKLRTAVRGYLLGAAQHPASAIDGSHEPFAFQQAIAMYNITSISDHPEKHSPYQVLNGVQPVFMGVPFGAPLFMHVPKDQRRQRRLHADLRLRGEGVLSLGPRSPFSDLIQCLTIRNTRRSSRTVLMAHDHYPLGVFPDRVAPSPVLPPTAHTHVEAAITKVTEVIDRDQRVRAVTQATREMLTAQDDRLILEADVSLERAKPYIADRCRALIGTTVSAALRSQFTGTDGHQCSYRRRDLNWDLDHHYLRVRVVHDQADGSAERAYDVDCAQAAHLSCLALAEGELDSETHASSPAERATRLEALLAVVAMSDLPWDRYLAGPERQHVIDAWQRELKALLELGAIVELFPGTPEWEQAINSQSTTPCRVLLSFKRDGTWKARCVIRGDLEDKVALDGADFSYFSNVSRLSTVRLSAMRPGRNIPKQDRVGSRRVSTCDISNAYLQSDPFPASERRYLSIRSPIDGQTRYYRQLVPIYGSCSAPVRWETTFSTWLTTPEHEGGPGFQRGDNEPSCYWHPHRDLLMVLYVDDQFLDGYHSDCEWYYSLLAKRFKIKPPVYLTPTTPLDHLGVGIFCDEQYMYMSMERYIAHMTVVLQRSEFLRRKSPISPELEITDLRPLSPRKAQFFAQALGMCAWLSATVRIDGRYALSRISQYAATPCLGAYNALIHLLDYYQSTPTLCLRQSLHERGEWTFYSDSDLAGNPEAACKRRSQLGYVALNNGCPIVWSSKVTSVQFAELNGAVGYAWGAPVVAHPDILDNHADVSSAAAEIYAAGTATMDLLGLSYVASEAGIPFPSVITLQVDNAACEAYANQTRYSGRSRLRHIDARQRWVQCLRDSRLVRTTHVPSPENLSDWLTKPLKLAVFLPMRARMMHFARVPVASP